MSKIDNIFNTYIDFSELGIKTKCATFTFKTFKNGMSFLFFMIDLLLEKYIFKKLNTIQILYDFINLYWEKFCIVKEYRFISGVY